MKKILIIISICFIGVFDLSAQFFQASLVIDNSVSPTVLRVKIRPFPGGGNITNVLWDRFEFFLRRDNDGIAPTFGDPVVNTTDFPSLGILKGGFGVNFTDGFANESGKTNYYFCSNSQANTTSAARTYNQGQEYEVFNVPVVSGSFSNFEFVADNVNGDPYFITLSRNIAGIGGEANLTASGALAPSNTPLFYGGSVTNTGSVWVQRPGLLPVTFKGFYAIKQGDNAKLTWDVSGDEKNSYFQVQRSTDGRNFSNIQKVEALKNGRSDNSYETMDLNLSKLGSKEVYYQIAQFDQDGTKTMSPVRKLSVDGLGKAVVAYPNPTPANAKLVVDAPEAGKGQIILRDNLGRQVQNINAQFNKGINQFELQMSGLSNGDYKVTVQGAGLNETIKLQKIR